MNFTFLKRYYETVLLIIEDRPKFEMPIGIYKALILTSYLQIFIYLMTDAETKPIYDIKLLSIAKIIQMVSVNNILALRSNDLLSLLVMLLAEIFVYFYFIYVAVLTILKEYFKPIYETQKKAFVNINQILNLYFALFMQVFFTFFIELNCSLFTCSDNSLFESERTTIKSQSCNPASWQIIVGILGLCLTFLTSWISIYFFRNYEFLESSLIKRRLSWIYAITVSLKFVLTLLYFENIEYLNEMKHIISQAIGVLSLLDFFLNKPYSDSSISSFYLKVISWYYVLVVMAHFWIFTSAFSHGEQFYLCLILGIIFDSFTSSLNERLLDFYMLTPIRPNYFPQKLDFFLEEMVRLTIDSSKTETSKIKLVKLFKNHLQLCENKDCPCREIDNKNIQINQAGKKNNLDQQSDTKSNYSVQQFKKQSNQESEGQVLNDLEISQEHVFAVVDAIFKYFLKQNKVISETAEYEHLSLKYITFMIKMLKNHTRANYELKVLSFLKTNFSSYFQLISSFISQNILEILQNMNMNLEERRKEEITVKQLVSIDLITYKYIPIILQIMVEKQQLWVHLQNGYRNMNDFQRDAIKLTETIQTNNHRFQLEMNSMKKQLQVSTCLQYQKLDLLFNLFVMNDTVSAFEIENLIMDLRKRDSLKDQETLHNENYLKAQIATVSISLAQSIGKIVSKKDEKTANFFGFLGQDFQKISKINELMPPYLSKIHDRSVKQFINRGESAYIKGNLFSFIRNQNGFIEHTKIYLDISTTLEADFTMHGTLLKINAAQDYIVFNRQGQVLGLTSRFAQYLLSISIQSGHKLPAGDLISQNLHALLLFPGITKKIFKRKDYILKNLKSQDEILISDKRCSITLHPSILTEIKKLYSFLNRSNAFQSKFRNKKQSSNVNGMDSLDIMSQAAYDILNNFQNQETYSSSQGGLSSDRKVNKQTAVLAPSPQVDSNKIIVLRFTYSLSYSTIANDLTNESQLIFQLKARDLSIGTQKKKEEASIRKSLCTYLLSTTSIYQMHSFIKNETMITDSNNLLQQPSENPLKDLSSLNEWVFSTDDIPQNLLRLAGSNINNSPLENMNSFQMEQHQSKQNDREKLLAQKSGAITEDEENENDKEEEDNEKNKIYMDDIRGKQSVNDQYERSKFEELDEIFQAHQIKTDKIMSCDPDFKIKKVIQAKTRSQKFGKALEKAILEALIELDAERQLLPNQNILELNDLATFREAPLFTQTMNSQKPEDQLLTSINRNNEVMKIPMNLIGEYTLDKLQTTETGNLQLQNSFINAQSHMDATFDNYPSVKINYDDQYKYTDVSARPLVTKASEINNYEVENIITVSMDDAVKPIHQTNLEIYNAAKRKDTKDITFKDQSSGLHNSLHFNEKVTSSLQNKETTLEIIQEQTSNLKKSDQKVLMPSTQLKANPLITVQQTSDAFSKNINSDANGNQAIDDISGKNHEINVTRILTQKGLANKGNNIANNLNNNNNSVNSSTRSSTVSGGRFLREIIKIHKLPKQSFQYSFLLITFIAVFICLNFTNLFIIQSDMQYFTDNVIVLRQPRKFLRAYGRCLYGVMIEMEIKIGYITDPDSTLAALSKNYLNYCSSEYLSLLQTYGLTMTTYTQKRQSSDAVTTIDMSIYTNQKLNTQTIEKSNVFMYNFNYIIGVMLNQTSQQRKDSYLFLRANYFQFSTNILDLGTFLVSTVLDTLDTLIVKFTVIAVAAISAVILVAILSLPVTRLTNLYEEKILLAVSRITYDQSQVEKLKLGVCQQLISLDSLDWLKYNYSDISGLKFNQFDANIVNSQHDSIQKVRKSAGVDRMNVEDALQNQNRTLYTTTGVNFSSKQQLGKSSVMKPVKSLFKNLKSTVKTGNISQKINGADNSQNNRSGVNKNYVLQSKISEQRLSIFTRFIPLFLLTIGNTIYFLIIIIYLQQNKDLLKEPVYLNKSAIIYHIYSTNLKISSELLSFDSTFSSQLFPSSHLTNDLLKYQGLMNTALQQQQQQGLFLTDQLYGSNSLPSDTVTTMKNFQEGFVCQYLVKFNCDQSTIGTKYGVNYMLQEKIRVIQSYPIIFSVSDAPLASLLAYADSLDHKQTWLQSLLIEDEVQDLQSSTSNLSIGTTSNSVQTFFEQYLLIFGDIFAGIIIIVCFFTYRALYHRIQLMNLFLTLIPEEKLQEEVTLQLLKTLRRM